MSSGRSRSRASEGSGTSRQGTPADSAASRWCLPLSGPKRLGMASWGARSNAELPPSLEGDSTALYLAEELAKRGVTVTRLARGLPSGSQLEFANPAVLADAIEGRQRMGE